jgi:DNA-binding response OmpR family regulator
MYPSKEGISIFFQDITDRKRTENEIERRQHFIEQILDVQMPGANGIQVLHQIKRYTPAPVAIILTNHTYIHLKHQCLEGGADYFFDKSTEVDALLARLRALAKNDSTPTGQPVA